ncbi:MAG: hypothetical protein WHV67_08595 [Thermoanaerobaculia bacterium]
MKIEFGTDGWRGKIGEDFSFKNIEKIGYAIINFLESKPKILPFFKREILIGYDTRFLGKETAHFLANLFSNYGFNVMISKEPVPTPALSYGTFHFKLPISLMITASHNPAVYNGIKVKAWYGGSALPEIYDGIKNLLNNKKPIKKSKGSIQEIDLIDIYIEYLKKNVNFEKIKENKIRILWDPMFGATSFIIKKLFKELESEEEIINSYPDPYFGGIQPEPIPKNLGKTIEFVKKNKFDISAAADGDGDRIGIITRDGEYLWNHTIIPILSLYYLEEKGERRGIAKTFSSTLYLNKIAKKYKIKIYETPIGFKYLCPYLMKKKVFIAGEESGGIAFSSSLPERDAILSFLKILEMLSEKGEKLEYFLNNLKKEFGTLHYKREDMGMKVGTARGFVEEIYKKPPKNIAGLEVSKVKKLDGVKLYFDEKGWLLFRASGTEDLLRIYCEMESAEEVEKVLSSVKEYVRNL